MKHGRFTSPFLIGGLVLILDCLLGCQAPVARATSASGKPTLTTDDPQTVALQARVKYAPRPASQFESSVVLSPHVKECLREGLRASPGNFFAQIEGRLGAAGAFEAIRVETPVPGLESCLQRAFPQVELGVGPSGPFKLEILRGSGKRKNLLLDLQPTKKFQ
ncbi:MAG: hypothetical protein AB7G93_15660 [Bdellovibrionales bacterium]